jgi:hypothetical protein
MQHLTKGSPHKTRHPLSHHSLKAGLVGAWRPDLQHHACIQNIIPCSKVLLDDNLMRHSGGEGRLGDPWEARWPVGG